MHTAVVFVVVVAAVAKMNEIYFAAFGHSFVYHIIAVDFGFNAAHTGAAGGGRATEAAGSIICLCHLELGGCNAGGYVDVTFGIATGGHIRCIVATGRCCCDFCCTYRCFRCCNGSSWVFYGHT